MNAAGAPHPLPAPAGATGGAGVGRTGRAGGGVAATAALLLAAALLRGVGLGDAAFWQDEALCVINARLPAEQLVAVLGAQNQPPGFHLVLGRWIELFGASEVAVRGFSAACGWATVVVFAALAVRLFGGAARRAALLVAGTSLCWVVWSRDGAMYALYLLLAAIQWWLLAEALFARGRARLTVWAVGGVLRGLLLWVHYFALILWAGEALVVGVSAWRRRRPELLAGFAAGSALTMAIFLPWLPVFLEQRARVAEGWWSQPLTLARVVNVPRQWTLWLPEVDHGPWNALLIPPALLAAGWLGGRALWRALAGLLPREAAPRPAPVAIAPGGAATPPPLADALLFAALGAGGQVAAALAGSLESSLMEPKYLLAATVPFLLLLVGGLRVREEGLAPGGRGDFLALGALVAAQLAGFALAQAHPGYRHPDTRGAARWLAERLEPGDAIVTISTTTLAPLYLYTNAGSEAVPLFFFVGEGGPPPFYEGLGALPQSSYVGDPDLLAAGQRRLWLLFPTWRDRTWEWSEEGARIEAAAVEGFFRTWGGGAPRPPAARFDRLEVYEVPVERAFDLGAVWPKWEAWMARWQADQRASALGRFLRPATRP